MPYEVVVGDNFKPYDKEEQYSLGVFETEAEAVSAAKQVIEKSLEHCLLPGISAADLFSRYSGFGDITFIFGNPKAYFDPWAYAKARAEEIAARSD